MKSELPEFLLALVLAFIIFVAAIGALYAAFVYLHTFMR